MEILRLGRDIFEGGGGSSMNCTEATDMFRRKDGFGLPGNAPVGVVVAMAAWYSSRLESWSWKFKSRSFSSSVQRKPLNMLSSMSTAESTGMVSREGVGCKEYLLWSWGRNDSPAFATCVCCLSLNKASSAASKRTVFLFPARPICSSRENWVCCILVGNVANHSAASKEAL